MKVTPLAWRPGAPPRDSKQHSTLTLFEDENGVTILLAALLFSIISIALAMVIDIGAIALRREQLTTMAEAGAAAGGRVVADYMTTLATIHTEGRTLSQSEAEHPEHFLTEDDRTRLLTDQELKEAVTTEAQKIIDLNHPPSGTHQHFDLNEIATIEYPARETDCAQSEKQFAVVKISLQAKYYPLLGRLIALFSGDGSLPLVKTSYYRLRVCP